MKAKRLLLPVVIVLLLLVVTLILPAVSQAANNDNQPVSWARSGGNTNNGIIGYQIGSSVLVKLLADESTVGHVTMQTMKEEGVPDARFWAKSTEFNQTATLFYEGTYYEFWSGKTFSGKIAVFEVVHDDEGMPLHSRWVLIDGGEPGTKGDLVVIYFWGPDVGPYPEMWVPFFDPATIEAGTADNNVQVHLAGE